MVCGLGLQVVLAQTPDYSGTLKVPSLQGPISNKVVGVTLLHSSSASLLVHASSGLHVAITGASSRDLSDSRPYGCRAFETV